MQEFRKSECEKNCDKTSGIDGTIKFTTASFSKCKCWWLVKGTREKRDGTAVAI